MVLILEHRQNNPLASPNMAGKSVMNRHWNATVIELNGWFSNNPCFSWPVRRVRRCPMPLARLQRFATEMGSFHRLRGSREVLGEGLDHVSWVQMINWWFWIGAAVYYFLWGLGEIMRCHALKPLAVLDCGIPCGHMTTVTPGWVSSTCSSNWKMLGPWYFADELPKSVWAKHFCHAKRTSLP
jgi:hypothetical protein